MQPGAILFGRFCAIGGVRHNALGWRVPVTDLQRKLGGGPHHRLDLVFLPVSESAAKRIRVALPSYQESCRRIHAIFGTPDGILLLTRATTTLPLPTIPLPQPAAGKVGRALGRILANLHAQGLVGARFEPKTLRIDADDRCQLAEWGHLLDLRHGADEADTRPDVDALLHVMVRMGVSSELLDPVPTTADELARRFDTDLSGGPVHALDVLPAIPPFVGRRAALKVAHALMSEARHGGPQVMAVLGPEGSGKTRLLEQLELEFRRGDGALCVRASRPTSQLGSQRLAEIMATIATETEPLDEQDRRAIAGRLQERTGPLSALVRQLDTRLGALAGQGPDVPALPLDKEFVRHAAVAASTAASVGTSERPLLLLVDDFDQVDSATRAMLYHLLNPSTTHHTLVVLTATEQMPALPREPSLVQLDALSLSELADWLAATLPGSIEDPAGIATVIHDLSEGNPDRAWNALQQAVHEGRLVARPAWRWTQPPPTGRVLHLTAPLAWERMSADAGRVACVVALRPELAGLSWLKRVMRWPVPRIEAATQELMEMRVLRWSDDSLLWTSDSVRNRVLQAAGSGPIRKAHAAVLRWLTSLGAEATPAQLAWHAEHALEPGPDAAVAQRHLVAGTALLRTYDAERSQWHFERALERTPQLPAPRRTVSKPGGRAVEGLADALLLQDRIDEALQSYVQAIELADDGPRALSIAIKAMHGMYLHGATSAAVVVADRALRRVGQRLPRNSVQGLLQGLSSLLTWRWRRPSDTQADLLCQLHWLHVGAVFTTHPHMVLSSLLRGASAAGARSSGATALARANLSIMLAGLGAHQSMIRVLERAQEDAEQANDVFALGVVHAARGTNLLGLGEYNDGQLYVQKAVHAFRAAGDLSVGVTTMALGVFYAIDREPAPHLLETLRAAESAAFRQRNKSVLPGLLGMRLWVRTRIGELSASEVEAQAHSLERRVHDADLVGAVVGDAFAAMALHRVNRLITADGLARRALERLDQSSLPPPFLSVALLAATQVAIGRVTYLGGARRARSLMRRLRRKSRTVRSIAVASDLAEASLCLAMGDVGKARTMLAKVIATSPSHRELWHELEAHELLARILPGDDPVAANVHAERAEILRSALQVKDPTAEHPLPAPMPPADETTHDTRIDTAVAQLLPLVEPHLSGRHLAASTQHGLRTSGPVELVELLLVNLVLAASDASAGDSDLRLTAEAVELSAEDAAKLPDAVTGHWARLQVRSTGPRGQGARGALAECSDLCRRIGGFLQVADGDQIDICAWLPAAAGGPPRSKGLLAVMVRDPRLQRTLIDGARQLGWSAQVLLPGESIGSDVTAVLAEPSARPEGSQRVAVFEVVERQGSWDRTQQLPVPFLVRELQALLSEVQEARGSSASASPPA